MSILTAAQNVSVRIGIERPTAFMASTDRELLELKDVSNRAADMIMWAHRWQVMMAVATITGDGSDEDFVMSSVASDYLRMDEPANLWSSSLETPLRHIVDRDEWLGLDVRSFDFVINAWTFYGSTVYIKPALANGATAKFFYQKNTPITDSGGTTYRTAWSADGDLFVLDQKLLEYCMEWLWLEGKGRPSGDAMANYQGKLALLITADKGSRMRALGRKRFPSDVRIAYPQSISG